MRWLFTFETVGSIYRKVLQTVERECDHTIELYTNRETIETTAEHPFYTTDGWKDAADLAAGDKIITRNNETVEITGAKFNYEPKRVYNFEVAEWHTYFVGALNWLVHNNPVVKKCVTNVITNWGAHLTKLTGEVAPALMKNPHAHHIVFKKGRGAMKKYLSDSKAILEKYGIDWYKGAENLIWAPNKNHSAKAAKAVRDALVKADKTGSKEEVVKALREMGKHFADDTIDTLY